MSQRVLRRHPVLNIKTPTRKNLKMQQPVLDLKGLGTWYAKNCLHITILSGLFASIYSPQIICLIFFWYFLMWKKNWFGAVWGCHCMNLSGIQGLLCSFVFQTLSGCARRSWAFRLQSLDRDFIQWSKKKMESEVGFIITPFSPSETY